MSNVDAHLWQGVMEVKLKFMYSNQVLEFIEAPEGTKPIECKWVYKRKRGVNGKLETYKTRLIVKGYSKNPSFDMRRP